MSTTRLDVMQLHFSFFFFNDTATTEIYTLSLHDALPIYDDYRVLLERERPDGMIVASPNTLHVPMALDCLERGVDRKSTRLNSSHSQISYAVFCLKKKKKQKREPDQSPMTIRMERVTQLL